jgi:4-hydroxy-tetrahydrodipicolinate reductase
MIKIGILGYAGRMGQAIAIEVAASDRCVLAGGVVRAITPDYKKAEGILITPHADEVIAISDVVIDFTLAEATPGYARLAATHKKPFMSGVTGLGADGLEVLKHAAKTIPVLYAPNTSVSLVAMKQITALAAKLLGPFDYDVNIHDEHHRMKKDAPSGTAKALGEAVARGNGGKKTPSYSSLRAGAIVGNHEVAFVGQGEIIRLQHQVTDRRIFAKGALQAALWLTGKPAGMYGMEDVVGI